jgi:hypothetical protein
MLTIGATEQRDETFKNQLREERCSKDDGVDKKHH